MIPQEGKRFYAQGDQKYLEWQVYWVRHDWAIKPSTSRCTSKRTIVLFKLECLSVKTANIKLTLWGYITIFYMWVFKWTFPTEPFTLDTTLTKVVSSWTLSKEACPLPRDGGNWSSSSITRRLQDSHYWTMFQPCATCSLQDMLLFASQMLLSQMCAYCDSLSCLHLLFLSQTLNSVSSLIATHEVLNLIHIYFLELPFPKTYFAAALQ